jgi:Methyltransferase domain
MPGNPKYLEIGTQYGLTLESIQSSDKTGVDPNPKFSRRILPSGIEIYDLKSDDYFSQLQVQNKWDFIFLDGLHEFRQTARDFENSLRHLSVNGFILVDDTIPNDEFSALPSQEQCDLERKRNGVSSRTWHGDVYKLIFMLAQYSDIFELQTAIYPGNPQTLVKVINQVGASNFRFSDQDFARADLLTFKESFANMANVDKVFNLIFERFLFF